MRLPSRAHIKRGRLLRWDCSSRTLWNRDHSLRGASCIYHKPQHLQRNFTYQKTRRLPVVKRTKGQTSCILQTLKMWRRVQCSCNKWDWLKFFSRISRADWAVFHLCCNAAVLKPQFTFQKASFNFTGLPLRRFRIAAWKVKINWVGFVQRTQEWNQRGSTFIFP